MPDSDSYLRQDEVTVPDNQETDEAESPDHSAVRHPTQWKLLAIAVLGIVFAVTYAWTIRANWMRLVDPLYGDPVYEALRRYDLEKAIVSTELFSVGNTRKDGVISLDEPGFISAKVAGSMRDEDRIIGIVIAGQSRAYPLKIMNYHEVVNDTVVGQAIAVTYCPLCDSSLVFDRSSPTGPIEFGVSGLLFNSNAVFYDRADSESLWSQMKAQSIYGPKVRQSLVPISHEITTWQGWIDRHPETLVLSSETGSGHDYNRPSPYRSYFAGDVPLPIFAVEPRAPVDQLDWLDQVLGVWTEDGALAFAGNSFQNSAEAIQIDAEVGGANVSIAYAPDARSLRVIQADDGVRWMYAFWFAWNAFHPETEIFDGFPEPDGATGKPFLSSEQ